jgi:uncharacterized integral membrane protein (TIGR00697 family)
MAKALTIPHIYESLAALFITTLIVSNIASTKLVGAGPLVFDAGTILFPLAYIVGDIVTEVYGFRKMRALIYIGIGMLLLTSLTFWLVGLLPSTPEWGNQVAYQTILGVVWRIIFASVIAILIGELVNAYILAKLKIKTKGKMLWHRLVGSSVAGNLVDTTVFTLIAFAGTVSGASLLNIIITVFLVKIITEIVVSPITMRIITHIKKHENIDVFEEPSLHFKG